MKPEDIEAFIEKKNPKNLTVQISFRNRTPVKAVFIKAKDYTELSQKNFWRVVTENHVSNYNISQDGNLSRIFNGSEFKKLELA